MDYIKMDVKKIGCRAKWWALVLAVLKSSDSAVSASWTRLHGLTQNRQTGVSSEPLVLRW